MENYTRVTSPQGRRIFMLSYLNIVRDYGELLSENGIKYCSTLWRTIRDRLLHKVEEYLCYRI